MPKGRANRLFQTAGVEGTFTIEAADEFGVPATRVGDEWVAYFGKKDAGTGDLSGIKTIQVSDLGTGKYTGAYVINAAGSTPHPAP